MNLLLLIYFICFQFFILASNNLTLTEIILLSFILWANFILFKIAKFNLKSPIFLFAIVIHICNILHVYFLAEKLNFNIIYDATAGYYFSRDTFILSLILNFISLIIIFLGILVGLKNKFIIKKKDNLNIIIKNSNLFLLIGFLFFLSYILSYGGFVKFYSNLYYIRNGILDAKYPILQIMGNFRYIYDLGLFSEIFKINNSMEVKNKMKIFILTIIGFLIALSSGGRFTFSFLFLQLFLLTYNPKKIKTSNIIFLTIFVLIVVIFFPIKWAFFRYLHGDLNFNELVQIYKSNSSNFLRDLIGNHMGSYSAFLVLLEKGRIYSSADLFFKPIINLISLIIPRRFLIGSIFEYKTVFSYYNEIINYNSYLLGEFHFNYLGYFYIILGYLGIVIFSFFLGLFLGILEKNYIKKDNKKYLLYLYLYSSFIFLMAMNGSFDSYLRPLAYRYIGLWLCLRIIQIKNSLKNLKYV